MSHANPPSAQDILHLAYAVPSHFTNQTHFVFLDGMVRITFMEQIVTPAGQVLSARSAVMMTYTQALDVAEKLKEFVKKNLEAGADAGATLQ